jgi:hypothetical protein
MTKGVDKGAAVMKVSAMTEGNGTACSTGIATGGIASAVMTRGVDKEAAVMKVSAMTGGGTSRFPGRRGLMTGLAAGIGIVYMATGMSRGRAVGHATATTGRP